MRNNIDLIFSDLDYGRDRSGVSRSWNASISDEQCIDDQVFIDYSDGARAKDARNVVLTGDDAATAEVPAVNLKAEAEDLNRNVEAVGGNGILISSVRERLFAENNKIESSVTRRLDIGRLNINENHANEQFTDEFDVFSKEIKSSRGGDMVDDSAFASGEGVSIFGDKIENSDVKIKVDRNMASGLKGSFEEDELGNPDVIAAVDRNFTEDSLYSGTYSSNVASRSVNNMVDDLSSQNAHNLHSGNNNKTDSTCSNKLLEKEEMLQEFGRIASQLSRRIVENYASHNNNIKLLNNRISNIESKLCEIITLLQSKVKTQSNNSTSVNESEYSGTRRSNKLFSDSTGNNAKLFNNLNTMDFPNQTSVQKTQNNSRVDDIRGFKDNQREIEKRAEIERLRKLEVERKKREDAERRRIEQEKQKKTEELEKKKKLDMRRKELMSCLFSNVGGGDSNSNDSNSINKCNSTTEKKPSLFGDEQSNLNVRASLFDD